MGTTKYNIYNIIAPTLLLIIIISFLLRFGGLFVWSHYAPIGDSIHFILLAQAFSSSGGDITLTHHFTPLYSVLISVFSLFKLSFFAAGRWVSIVSSVLLVIPYYYLCRQLLGSRMRIFSIVLLAFSPLLVNVSLQIWAESLYFLLLYSGLYFAYQFYTKESVTYILLSAIFFAVAFYTREETILPVMLTFLFLLMTRTHSFLHILLLPAIYLLLLIPRFMELHSYFGAWILTAKDITNAVRFSVFSRYFPLYLTDAGVYQTAVTEWLRALRAVDDSGNLAIFSLAGKYSVARFIFTQPLFAVTTFFAHWKEAIRSLPVSAFVLILFSITGALNLFWMNRRRSIPLLFLFFATTPIIAASPFIQLNQFSIPPYRLYAIFIPLACSLCAMNLRYIILLPQRRQILKFMSLIIVIVASGLGLWSLLLARKADKFNLPYWEYLEEIKREAESFSVVIPAESRLSTPHEYFLFYLPHPSVIYPQDTPEKNHIYFHRHNVTHLILSQEEWKNFKSICPQILLSHYIPVKQTKLFILIQIK